MSTILTSAIIQNAESAVDEYVATVNSLNSELQSVMSNLTSNFMGDAADGYTEFFNQKILPAINENLVDPSASLTASIKTMLDSIQQQLLNTVDPTLGNNNRGAGTSAAGAGVAAGAAAAGAAAVGGALGG